MLGTCRAVKTWTIAAGWKKATLLPWTDRAFEVVQPSARSSSPCYRCWRLLLPPAQAMSSFCKPLYSFWFGRRLAPEFCRIRSGNRCHERAVCSVQLVSSHVSPTGWGSSPLTASWCCLLLVNTLHSSTGHPHGLQLSRFPLMRTTCAVGCAWLLRSCATHVHTSAPSNEVSAF